MRGDDDDDDDAADDDDEDDGDDDDDNDDAADGVDDDAEVVQGPGCLGQQGSEGGAATGRRDGVRISPGNMIVRVQQQTNWSNFQRKRA